VRALKIILVSVVSLAVIAGLLFGGLYWFGRWQSDREQAALEAFYTPPAQITGDEGDIIRSEPAPDWDVESAKATRILYVTLDTNTNTKRVAGGTVWIPTKAVDGERRVVAWAHPTVGLGNSCAPSRNPKSLSLTNAWIQQMGTEGWIVTATDYSGLGTPPPYTYLEGLQESTDVVNSVRAASQLPDARAGTRWGVFGHSQGGHSALWTATLAPGLAPELDLVGAAAAAPASDLYATINQQWDKTVSWVIGPEVVVSWPDTYPGLDSTAVVSSAGENATESQAQDCLTAAGLFGLARQELVKETYFKVNPYTNEEWAKALDEQTPKPTKASMPIFVAQGTADEVVLANSTAAMQKQWCEAGSDLTMDWLGDVSHQDAGKVSGPAVVDWMADRFEGKPTTPNCEQTPPVAPYEPPPGSPPRP
jgi:pimeloyl-ACP methyl ester carboxylesterase